MGAVSPCQAFTLLFALLAVEGSSSTSLGASDAGNVSANCSGLKDAVIDCSVRIRDRASNGLDYCSVEFDHQSCRESCCRLGTCEVEADFWHDCEVRIEDRERTGQDYCAVPFDRLGCMKSCCIRLGTTTTTTAAGCESLADTLQDCEVRIRDRFYDNQDYCAMQFDRDGCMRSCCLKLGVPIVFNVTLEGLDSDALKSNGSLLEGAKSAVQAAIANETGVNRSNVSADFNLGIATGRRLVATQLLLAEISIEAPSGVPPAVVAAAISPTIAVAVAASVGEVPGISSVQSGNISVASVTPPEVARLPEAAASSTTSFNVKAGDSLSLTHRVGLGTAWAAVTVVVLLGGGC